MIDLLGAFEIAGIDDGRRDEDELLEVARKRLMNRQDLMQPEAGERGDADDRGGLARIEIGWRDVAGALGNGNVHKDLVEPAHVALDVVVVSADGETNRDGRGGDDEDA